MAMLGRDIGKDLVRVLGLPRGTKRVDISVAVDEIVEITCCFYPSVDKMHGLLELLQRYGLQPNGEAEVIAVCDGADDGWRILPKNQWQLEQIEGVVLAGIFADSTNVRQYIKFPLSALPNHLIGFDDMVRAGIVGAHQGGNNSDNNRQIHSRKPGNDGSSQ